MNHFKYFIHLYIQDKHTIYNGNIYDRTEAYLNFYDMKKKKTIVFYAKRNNLTGESDVSTSFSENDAFPIGAFNDYYLPISVKEAMIFNTNNRQIVCDALLIFDKAKIVERLNIDSLIPYMIYKICTFIYYFISLRQS